jgi:hypothetical protein
MYGKGGLHTEMVLIGGVRLQAGLLGPLPVPARRQGSSIAMYLRGDRGSFVMALPLFDAVYTAHATTCTPRIDPPSEWATDE